MSVFLNSNLNLLCKNSIIFNFSINKILININFSSKTIFKENYKLGKNTHTNNNLHGIVLEKVYHIGDIVYKSQKTKVLYSDILDYVNVNYSNNFPTANPQFINNEFVILILSKPTTFLKLTCILIHELGHIITLKEISKEHYIKDISELSLHSKEAFYEAGTFEGLADAFAYAQCKGNKDLFEFLKTKYYLLFYGSEGKYPQLKKIRKDISYFLEYKAGYSSIIKEDIYSSNKIKEFL